MAKRIEYTPGGLMEDWPLHHEPTFKQIIIGLVKRGRCIICGRKKIGGKCFGK